MQHQTKRAYNEYENNMVIFETNTNTKKIYSFINSKIYDSSSVSLIKKYGLSHSDAESRPNILNYESSSVFTKEGPICILLAMQRLHKQS